MRNARVDEGFIALMRRRFESVDTVKWLNTDDWRQYEKLAVEPLVERKASKELAVPATADYCETKKHHLVSRQGFKCP